jgi:hypothetical protein
MLQKGGEFQVVKMQVAAGATGNGTVATPVAMENGAFNTLTAQVTGITTATITWEGTVDGTNYVGFLMAPVTTGTLALTSTADNVYRGTVTGFVSVRARISAFTTGTIYVTGILTKE